MSSRNYKNDYNSSNRYRDRSRDDNNRSRDNNNDRKTGRGFTSGPQQMYNKPMSKPMNNINNNPQLMGSKLKDIDWTRQQLTPFTKVFYKEGQSKRETQEVEQFRKQHEILIKESFCKVPNPFISWDETFFPPYIMQEIKNAGFPSPTAIQSQAFPIILSGHDFIGIAKTGSGKTLSFLLPSVVHINAQPPVKPGDGPIVLVLSPTRELAVQIQDECQKFGSSSKLSSTCVYGGSEKYGQLADLRKGVDILIATPGRLIEFLEKNETNLRRVTYLCLDEADRMLDMGFEQQIRKILGQIRPDRQTVMFSATWPKEVQGLAKDFCIQEPIYIQIGNYQNTVNTDIRQICEVLGQSQKTDRLIKYLCSMKSIDKVLIFTQTKKQCEQISQTLRYERFPAIPIHGDKSQQDRDAAIEAFRQGQCRILIATDVASRGLDIKNVTFVINYDMPKLIENYIHRIGRTGRAGASGTSISFLTYDEDKKVAMELIQVLEEARQEVSQELRDLALAGRQEQTRKNQVMAAKRNAMKHKADTWDTSENNVFKQYKDKYAYLIDQKNGRGGGNLQPHQQTQQQNQINHLQQPPLPPQYQPYSQQPQLYQQQQQQQYPPQSQTVQDYHAYTQQLLQQQQQNYHQPYSNSYNNTQTIPQNASKFSSSPQQQQNGLEMLKLQNLQPQPPYNQYQQQQQQ